MRKAVIDVGSNSVLLTVAEQFENGWNPLFESSAVTALGEGTKQTGLLAEPNLTRTLEAIQVGFAKARELGAEEIVCAATMAARIATNAASLLERADAQGTPVFILSGEREAELGLKAVLDDPAFAAHERLSIVDVGGHSTEIVVADRAKVWFRRSFPVGTLGLRGESPTDTGAMDGLELMRMASRIDDRLGFCCLPHQGGFCVALGATGTNLVTLREQMTTWQPDRVHGAWLDYEEVSKAAGWLCQMTDTERAALVGLEKGRERSIHLGSLILERGLFALRVLGCGVSVRGWRYGLLAES